MIQLTHIVAATDLSTNSLPAIDRGFRIAKTSGARLTLIHALGLDVLTSLQGLLGEDYSSFATKITDEALRELAEIAAAPERNLGLRAGLQVDPEPAVKAIPAYADTVNAGLILLGEHGESLFRHLPIGSAASRLLRTSKRPILLVKQPAREDYRRLLLAIDFSPSSETVIRLARAVAPTADIVLFHVFEVPFEGKMRYVGISEDNIRQFRLEARERAVQQLHALAKSTGLPTSAYTALVEDSHGSAAHQIVEQGEKYNCDLLVAGKHGRNVSSELLFGSVTRRVVAETNGDVLVVVDERMPADFF